MDKFRKSINKGLTQIDDVSGCERKGCEKNGGSIDRFREEKMKHGF